MEVKIIRNDEGTAIGWTIEADQTNREEVLTVNTIRNMQFIGMGDTAIEYGGRTGGSETSAGKLKWVQKKYNN